jgi:type IV pilus assembly protein PilB
VLLRLNLTGEREILQAKAQEMGYAFADLDRVVIDPEAIASVPQTVCSEHKIIPVKRDGSNLWLALAEPNDRAALEAVRVVANCRIIPVLAVSSAIDEAIAKYYGAG